MGFLRSWVLYGCVDIEFNKFMKRVWLFYLSCVIGIWMWMVGVMYFDVIVVLFGGNSLWNILDII